MLRYDSMCLTCSKKLTDSQLSLPHGTNKKLNSSNAQAFAEDDTWFWLFLPTLVLDYYYLERTSAQRRRSFKACNRSSLNAKQPAELNWKRAHVQSVNSSLAAKRCGIAYLFNGGVLFIDSQSSEDSSGDEYWSWAITTVSGKEWNYAPRLPRPLGGPAAMPQQLYKPASRGLSAIAELLVIIILTLIIITFCTICITEKWIFSHFKLECIWWH